MSQTLPAGNGQSLVAERCTTCHDLQRIVVKRTPLVEWQHIIERMRGNMAITNIPDITNEEAATAANYLAANFKPEQPYDPNSRLPRELLTGKALKYRAVTYDLVNRFAEPHDTAADPTGQCLGGGTGRQARPLQSQDLRIRRDQLLRPARRRRTASASAIRRSIRTASCGWPTAPTAAG